MWTFLLHSFLVFVSAVTLLAIPITPTAADAPLHTQNRRHSARQLRTNSRGVIVGEPQWRIGDLYHRLKDRRTARCVISTPSACSDITSGCTSVSETAPTCGDPCNVVLEYPCIP
jgi:hypothetical protein